MSLPSGHQVKKNNVHTEQKKLVNLSVWTKGQGVRVSL